MNELINGYYWTYKRGSVGKVLRGNLRDANGAFEITGALTVTAFHPRTGAKVIDGASCAPDPDQSANKGDFSFTLDSSAATVAADTYHLEFRHVSGGVTSFWPDDANPTKQYGKLKVTRNSAG